MVFTDQNNKRVLCDFLHPKVLPEYLCPLRLKTADLLIQCFGSYDYGSQVCKNVNFTWIWEETLVQFQLTRLQDHQEAVVERLTSDWKITDLVCSLWKCP